jgi:cyclomaltodextrinase / maltogenic alpha-amylase / neopullulanase
VATRIRLLVVLLISAFTIAVSQDSVDVTFRYSPPGNPSAVYLVGEFNGWNNQTLPMTPTGNNVFVRTARLRLGGQPGGGIGGAYQYKFYYAGVSNWPNDPLNHLFNPNDNNDSYVYVNDPTIYQLVPNERTGVVGSSTPTVTAYIFPKVGSQIDTSAISLKLGNRFYTGLGRFYDRATRQFSFQIPDPIGSGVYRMTLEAGTSADSVSITVQAGAVQITNIGNFTTRNAQRTLYGIVQDTTVHTVKIIRNNVDTTLTVVAGGVFSLQATLKEGVNTFKAMVGNGSTGSQISDPVSFTLFVNHSPNADIYCFQAGSNLMLSAQGSSDPDSGQSQQLTYRWSADATNPQQLPGVNGSTSALLSVNKPSAPGEYFVTLVATDPDGHKDTTRNFFSISADGSLQGASLATVPQWVKQGRVYELFFKSMTRQGTIAAALPYLPYLKSLGVNILWVMPVMENAATINNRTGPGYNIKNFLKVAPEYGTNDDFKAFVSQAHQLGLKVILDVTPNHTSYQHPFVLEARQFRLNSSYWNFYQHTIIPHNTNNLGQSTTSDGFVYYSGFSDQLLNYNWSDVDARTYMLEVYKWWIREMDIDGYRFDVYWGPHRRAGGGAGNELEMGLPVRKALKKLKPDIFLLAEDDGTGSGSEVIFADKNGGVDAGYDWNLYWNAFNPAPRNIGTINQYIANYGSNNLMGFIPGPNSSFLRFLENHDQERIVTLYNSYEMTMPAATVLMTAPGLPMIYSGQEVGYGLGISDFYQRTRGVVDWNWAAKSLLMPHYQRLAQIRAQFPAFSTQKFVWLPVGSTPVYAFIRPLNGGDGLVFANLGADVQDVSLTIPNSILETAIQDGRRYYASDLYNDTSYTLLFSGGTSTLQLKLKPYGSAVLVLSDSVKRVTLPVLTEVRDQQKNSIPSDFRLEQNFPNPFNPSTTIRYELPTASTVTVRVYNVLGEEVSVLVNERQSAGTHEVRWNAQRTSGTLCASGVYFVRIDAAGFIDVKRMVLLK